MEHWERDKRIWRFLRRLLDRWVRHKFNYSSEPVEAEGPFLLLANHATDWDPILIGLSFEQQMYFVASEHIFRWGLVWNVINWLVHPIARLKGTTASDTVMTVMRRMKKGANVAIFADGNRTWDGKTGQILPSTGKLAKSCGGGLITYRLEGGYFSNPRWSGTSLRRGEMHGHAVGIYTREQLHAMTPDQINEIINRDLWEDAYARQRENPVRYRGRNLAGGLENMLCVCPKCEQIGRLKSSGNRFSCTCGLSALFTEFGFLEGEDLPFDNTGDWDAWQTERLFELTRFAADGTEIFSDHDISLRQVLERHREKPLGTGKLSLYRDRLVFEGYDFPLRDISGMGMHGPLGLVFTSAGKHYELSSKKQQCLRKYMTTYDYLHLSTECGKEEVEQC